MTAKTYAGWHFLRANCRLGYGDGRRVKAGQTLTVDGPPVLCERGLHASAQAIDALGYAPGLWVSRVILGGTIVRGDDKAAATERTTLWLADATETVVQWAGWCAVGALLGVRDPDPRSVAAALAAYQYRRGKRTAARTAADAAWAAADAWDVALDLQNAELERRLWLLASKEAA